MIKPITIQQLEKILYTYSTDKENYGYNSYYGLQREGHPDFLAAGFTKPWSEQGWWYTHPITAAMPWTFWVGYGPQSKVFVVSTSWTSGDASPDESLFIYYEATAWPDVLALFITLKLTTNGDA